MHKIGQKVRTIASERTTNWTRIDIGRTGTITDYHVHSFSSEQGPRVLLLVRYDEVAKWDSRPGEPVYLSPCQVEALCP